jgi:hypothetical protein
MIEQTPQQRRWIRWIEWAVGIVAGLVILTVVVTSIYVHTITAPALLTLPKVADSGTSSGQSSVDSVWNVGSGSVVGWRVDQKIFGQLSPIVGRTGKVWGAMTVVGGTVTQGSFSVDMADLTSSLSTTTRRTVFDISAYPTASLTLSSPITLGTIPAGGAISRYAVAGTITMHGVSHVVHFAVSAERASDGIYVLADITFPYGDWNISAQGVPFLADLQSPATIEVLLHLTQGAGNPASASVSGEVSEGGAI